METKWKFEIGEIVKNDYRDVTILDRKIEKREWKTGTHLVQKYKYKCNICNYEGWASKTDFSDPHRDFHVCNKFNRFKYQIGQYIVDNKRDLTIIEKEYKKIEGTKGGYKKWYKYKCNKCGWNEGWILESCLNNGNGCRCCAGKEIVEGINDIYTLHPELKQYVLEPDSLKTLTCGSSKKIICRCPYCGQVQIKICNELIKHGFKCKVCSDGLSFPEKFVHSFLNQLNVLYINQLSKKNLSWCDKYYYDIYFIHEGQSYIIEVNGLQHYENSYSFYSEKGSDKLYARIENDKTKKDLALKNGILEDHYIELDCRKSNEDYIVKSIKDSILSKIFNLERVDFGECTKYAMTSQMVLVCMYYKEHPEATINYMASLFKKSRSTIRKYLQRGDKCGMIEFDSKEHLVKKAAINGYKNGKAVNMYDENYNLLGSYESCIAIERCSEEKFGVLLEATKIRAICTGARKSAYKGYYFKYL